MAQRKYHSVFFQATNRLFRQGLANCNFKLIVLITNIVPGWQWKPYLNAQCVNQVVVQIRDRDLQFDQFQFKDSRSQIFYRLKGPIQFKSPPPRIRHTCRPYVNMSCVMEMRNYQTRCRIGRPNWHSFGMLPGFCWLTHWPGGRMYCSLHLATQSTYEISLLV